MPSGRSSLPLHSGYGALWSARSSGSLTGSRGCHSARRGPRRGHGAAPAAGSLPLCSAAALTAAAGGAPWARVATPPRRLPARQPRLLLPARPAAPACSLLLRPRSTTGGGNTSSGRRPGNSSAAEARGAPTGSGSTAPWEGAGRGRGGAGRDAGPGRRARREDAAGRRRQAPPRKARPAGRERGRGDLPHPGPGAVLSAGEPLPPCGDSAGAPLGGRCPAASGRGRGTSGAFPGRAVRGRRCWGAGPPPARRPPAVPSRGSAAGLAMPPASLLPGRDGAAGSPGGSHPSPPPGESCGRREGSAVPGEACVRRLPQTVSFWNGAALLAPGFGQNQFVVVFSEAGCVYCHILTAHPSLPTPFIFTFCFLESYCKSQRCRFHRHAHSALDLVQSSGRGSSPTAYSPVPPPVIQVTRPDQCRFPPHKPMTQTLCIQARVRKPKEQAFPSCA